MHLRIQFIHRQLGLLVLAILFVLPLSYLQAADISTLRQSVEFALQHNRTLVANHSRSIEKSKIARAISKSHYLPRIDLSSGVSRTDIPGHYLAIKLNQNRMTADDFNPQFINQPGAINNYQTRLQMSLPIYKGGALRAENRLTEHQMKYAEYGHQSLQQQVIFQTINAYAQARQSFHAISATGSAVKAAEKRFQDTKALKKRGVLIESDVMDANVHLLKSQLKFKQAKNHYAQALEQLEYLLGLQSSQGHLTIKGEALLKENHWNLADAIEKALHSRLDIKSIQAQLDSGQAEKDIRQSAFLPQLNLVAAQEWNDQNLGLNNGHYMLGANLSINLYSGGVDRNRTRQVESQIKALKIDLQDQQQKIRNQVSQAWRTLDESISRYKNEQESLKQSQESLRIKSLRFDQGLIKISDVLDAQLQVDNMQLSAIKAKYDITIARAALFLATGTLNIEVIQ